MSHPAPLLPQPIPLIPKCFRKTKAQMSGSFISFLFNLLFNQKIFEGLSGAYFHRILSLMTFPEALLCGRPSLSVCYPYSNTGVVKIIPTLQMGKLRFQRSEVAT